MIAYTFLGKGAFGLLGGVAWPRPSGASPGRWISATGPLEPATNGIHACGAHTLPAWLDDELWLVELGGRLLRLDDVLVARRGRLLDRVVAWDAAAARSFVGACVARARECAAAALERRGSRREAAALRAARNADETLRVAGGLAASLDGDEASSAAFVADLVCLARGQRPDAWLDPTARSAAVPVAAIAANVGYVAAHRAGVDAAAERGPDAYGPAFDAERRRQAEWLGERLQLRAATRRLGVHL